MRWRVFFSAFASASRTSTLFSFPFATNDFLLERLEFWLPESAEGRQPHVNVFKTRRVERIDSTRAINADGRESIFPQQLEMLGYRRLRYVEFVANKFNHFPGRQGSVGQMFENSSPHRITQNIKSVHPNNFR